MTRLKKIAENNEDDLEGLKEETLQCIKNMSNHVNEWSVRDILTNFTNWGFYKGQAMASIDEKLAKDICDQLYKYVEDLYDENDIYNVYDIVYRYR